MDPSLELPWSYLELPGAVFPGQLDRLAVELERHAITACRTFRAVAGIELKLDDERSLQTLADDQQQVRRPQELPAIFLLTDEQGRAGRTSSSRAVTSTGRSLGNSRPATSWGGWQAARSSDAAAQSKGKGASRPLQSAAAVGTSSLGANVAGRGWAVGETVPLMCKSYGRCASAP